MQWIAFCSTFGLHQLQLQGIPFSCLFGGREKRTELSNLSNSSRKSAARDNVAAFSNLNERRKAKLALFKEGDSVLARQGKGGKFCLPGTICKPAGKGAWLIDTASGQQVYNQSHLLLTTTTNRWMRLMRPMKKFNWCKIHPRGPAMRLTLRRNDCYDHATNLRSQKSTCSCASETVYQ